MKHHGGPVTGMPELQCAKYEGAALYSATSAHSVTVTVKLALQKMQVTLAEAWEMQEMGRSQGHALH